MMPWKYVMMGLLTAAAGLTSMPVEAGWQNTFQVTCFRRRPTVVQYAPAPVISYYAPPTVDVSCYTPPQQVCTTRYIQRSFYQPVTTYQTRSYYEPVTTYRTSYYYEPSTSYRYSYYYDPCTCSYKMVGNPVTTYHLKQQVCPVQSFVQRTMTVPVTTYRIATYYEPQTCCTLVAPTPTPCCGAPTAPAAPAPTVTEGPSVSEGSTPANPPSVQEQRQPADSNSPLYNTNKPNQQQMPQAPTGTNNATGFRPSLPPMRAPVAPPRPLGQPPRLDKIASDTDWRPAQGAKAELARRITIVDDE